MTFLRSAILILLAITSTPVNAQITEDFRLTYTGQAPQNHVGSFLLLDRNRNVLLVGLTGSSQVVLKFSPTGEMQWENLYSGSGLLLQPYPSSAVIDRLDNVYVAGGFSGEKKDMWISKVDPLGVRLWTTTFNGLQNDQDYAMDVAVDASGNSYICGVTARTSSTNLEGVILKVNSEGIVQWNRTFPFSTFNGAMHAVTITKLGNIIVTGNNGDRWATMCLDSNGTVIWYREPSLLFGSGYDIITDNNENVYAVGHFMSGGASPGETIIKYGPLGNEIWRSTSSNSQSFVGDHPRISFDETGNILATQETLDFRSGYRRISVLGTTLESESTSYRYTPDQNFAQADPNGNMYSFSRIFVKFNEYGKREWTLIPAISNYSHTSTQSAIMDGPDCFYISNYSTSSGYGISLTRYQKALVPSEFIASRGTRLIGSLNHVRDSDDSRLFVGSDGTGQLRDGIHLKVRFMADDSSSGLLKIRCERKADWPGISEKVELFNYEIGNYEIISFGQVSGSDQFLKVDIPNGNRFISVNGELTARIAWIGSNQANIAVRIDQMAIIAQ